MKVIAKRRRLEAGKAGEDVVIKTACYPKDFKLTCEALSSSKRNAVVQMGFGPLMEMGCIKLNRDLCQMVVDNLDVQQGRCSIQIQGRYLSINATVFERVMGVRNTGTRVELGCVDVDDMKELRRKLCGGNEDISVDSMKQIIVAREEADDVFKSFFVMYTLVVLLCPTTPYTVDMRFLVALSDASSIGSKNWASLCFRHLLDGVVAYKNNRTGYMSGCMVFLQLFYFDAVGYSSSIVCKSVLPVVAWTSKKCKQMTEWVIGEGGFHSTFVNVGNIVAAEFGGSEAAAVFSNSVDVTVSDDMLRAMHEIDSLQNEVDRLNSVMDIMEANMDKFSSMFTEIEMISHDMTEVGLRRRFLYAVRNVFGSGVKSSLNLDNDVEVNLNDGISMDTEMLRRRPQSPIFDDGPNETEWCEYPGEEDVAVDAGDNGFGIERDDDPVGNDKIGFPLEGKMSPGDFKLLKFVFDEPHIGADKSSEVVARYGELMLTKAEIECMRPGNTITSKVINLFAAYLCETESTTWFFPTKFGERCLGSDKQGGRVESLASIITDCGLHKFNRRLKLCCKIFIPVKDETLDHWFLVVIKVRDKVVEIWDSKADMASLRRRHEKATSVILLVQKVFASDMKKPGDIYYNFPSFEVTVPTGNRWDMNGYESGIYMMRHMQFYGEPWYDGFESSKERTEIALFIVKNSKNEDLKSLRAAAGLSVIGNKKACKLTSLDVEGDMKDEGARPVDNDNNPTGRKMRSHRKRKDPA